MSSCGGWSSLSTTRRWDAALLKHPYEWVRGLESGSSIGRFQHDFRAGPRVTGPYVRPTLRVGRSRRPTACPSGASIHIDLCRVVRHVLQPFILAKNDDLGIVAVTSGLARRKVVRIGGLGIDRISHVE